MKTLVAFYSRSGNTRTIAHELAKQLKADTDDIIDNKERKRTIIGWLIAGRDASARKITTITCAKDPKNYDVVIIGTPVWAWTMVPAIRAYLLENKNKFKKVAFFCTNGGNKGKTFAEIEQLSKKPIATLDIFEKEINTQSAKKKITDFCAQLTGKKKVIVRVHN